MNENLKILLGLLRESGLGWLAEEIEMTIEESRQSQFVAKPQVDDELFGAADMREFTFGLEDELRLAIETVHAHLIQPMRMWNEADRIFQTQAEGNIALVEGDKIIKQPFDREMEQSAGILEKSLAELWPGGEKEFYANFSGEAGQP